MEISAQQFNLNSRTKLEQLDTKHIAIIKLVKSRIIRKDALKILEMVDKIQSKNPELKVSLVCTTNICSKSIALLTENNIDVIYRNQIN